MSTYSREFLSGSTNGRGIKVSATTSPGTTIHTAHATSKDEVWLYAANSDTTDRKLTIEFGGTTVPDDNIEITIPAEAGAALVVPGFNISNSLVIKAFAASADKIVIFGWVNRIT